MKFSKGFATILIVICAAISIACAIIIPSRINQAQVDKEADLPQSAVSAYLQELKDGDYQSIYEDSLLVNQHYNTQEDYINALTEIYDSIDINDIELALDESDSTLVHLVVDGVNIADVQCLQQSDGTYVASTVFTSSSSYTIEVASGSTLTINGYDVDDAYITSEAIDATIYDGIDADDYDVVSVDQYTITNLINIDSIAIDGQSASLYYDVVNKIYYAGIDYSDSTLENTIIAAAKAAAQYPAQEGSKSALASYCITSSDFYTKYSTMENTWFTSHSSAVFSNEQVTQMIQLDDNCILATVTMDYDVSGSLGSKQYNIGYQMALINVNGSYKIAGFGIDSRLNANYQEAY